MDGNGNKRDHKAYTHITQLIYTGGSTIHNVTVMRPLNWTYITTAVAHNSQTVVLAADPGIYSTNYKYPLPGGVTKPAVGADDGIAGSDYVAFQLKDGSWHVSAVTSVSSLTLTITTATPNVSGGGAAANTVLYFFGAAANVNPQTGAAHLYVNSIASARGSLISDGAGPAAITSLNPGDPLLIYSSNVTAAGFLNACCGIYADK